METIKELLSKMKSDISFAKNGVHYYKGSFWKSTIATSRRITRRKAVELLSIN